MKFLTLQNRTPWPVLIVIAIALLLTLPMTAQDETTGDSPVTDNEVNAIAKKLYCPVCENIPLDACGTAACDDWRYEIRLQLEAGMTEDQIVADFVARFGDRVVGTPKTTLPRLVSLVTPWLAIAAGLYFGARVVLNKRRATREKIKNVPSAATDAPTAYRDLLEQDVTG